MVRSFQWKWIFTFASHRRRLMEDRVLQNSILAMGEIKEMMMFPKKQYLSCESIARKQRTNSKKTRPGGSPWPLPSSAPMMVPNLKKKFLISLTVLPALGILVTRTNGFFLSLMPHETFPIPESEEFPETLEGDDVADVNFAVVSSWDRHSLARRWFCCRSLAGAVSWEVWRVVPLVPFIRHDGWTTNSGFHQSLLEFVHSPFLSRRMSLSSSGMLEGFVLVSLVD